MLWVMGDDVPETGEDKMSGRKQVQYMIYKGNPDISGAGDKVNGISIVMELLGALMPGAKLFYGDEILSIKVPDEPGDTAWMRENVLRKVELTGLIGREEVMRRAGMAVVAYNEARGSSNPVGHDILRYLLDRYMMKYDVWRL